jgi:Secretion system C-terminal sorting domain
MRQFATQPRLFVFFVLSLWLSPNKMSAQLTLEATYPTTDLRRIHLPVSGEKWYYADDSTRKIYLFNANHTAWKTVNYPSETNKTVSLAAMNMPVSETTFNTDNLLEFVWIFKDTTTYRERIRILNERNDTVYAFAEGRNYLNVNELPGSSAKLFAESGNYEHQKTAIFSLPNMILDTTFDYAGDMQRRKFSYAGEKFYSKNRNTNFLEIFNPNYTRWKSFKIHNTRNELNIRDDIFFADDRIFNADTLVECMLTYWHGNGWPLKKIVSEKDANTSNRIIYADTYSKLWLDQKEGQPDKLIFDESYNNDMSFRCKIFGLPQNTLEATYSVPIQRISLKNYGPKYTSIGYRFVKLFSANHSDWKMITLVPTLGYDFLYNYGYDISMPLVCDSIVHPDSLLEVIWNEWKRITPKTLACQLRITAENGNNIITVPNASFVEVNQLDKLTSKLITKTWDSTRYTETKVWRFTARTPVSDPSVSAAFDAQVSPNPFNNSFTINVLGDEGPLSIRLFNAIGTLVFSEKTTSSNATFTPPNGLPQGIYWCQISDGKSQIVKKLVKMN